MKKREEKKRNDVPEEIVLRPREYPPLVHRAEI